MIDFRESVVQAMQQITKAYGNDKYILGMICELQKRIFWAQRQRTPLKKDWKIKGESVKSFEKGIRTENDIFLYKEVG